MTKRVICLISGTLSSLVGLCVILGWILKSTLMVQIIPGSPVIVFNTALFFILCGLYFIFDHFELESQEIKIGLNSIIVIGALLIFIENMFNISFGIDLDGLHKRILSGSNFIARPGQNVCVNFILLSTYFLIKDRLSADLSLKGASWVSYAVSIISGLGFLGALLQIELFYPWYHDYTISGVTCLIFIMLSIALKLKWGSADRAMKKEDFILPLGFAISILLGIVAIAAYAPIGQSGMELPQLLDSHEVLKKRFLIAFFSIVTFISLGMFALSKCVKHVMIKLNEMEDSANQYAQKFYHVQDQLRTITDSLPALIAYITKDGCYEFVNKTFEDWYRMPRNKIIGKSIPQVLGDEHYKQIKPFVMEVLSGETVSFEQESSGSSHVPRFTLTTFTPGFKGKKIDGFYVMVSDISNRKIHEEHITHLAHHDNLTGLANRALFYQRLDQAILNCKRNFHISALLYMDVDKFKSINDTLGHAIGDELLKEFARRLVRSVRSTDTVARLGGDEFTVIIEGVGNEKNAELIVNKILSEIRMPFNLDGTLYNITSSIGVAYFNPDAKDRDELIKRSDTALYKAKHAGRNCFQVAD